MPNVKYSNVTEYLFANLPSIRVYYEARSAELYAGNNPHVIFGSILVDYANEIYKNLVASIYIENDNLLKDIFSVLENLSASSDFETRCLMETTVLEGLLGEDGGLERFARYMGPETKKLARSLAEDWGLNTDILGKS